MSNRVLRVGEADRVFVAKRTNCLGEKAVCILGMIALSIGLFRTKPEIQIVVALGAPSESGIEGLYDRY